MSTVRSRGPIVIDTDVFSADLVPGSRLAERYASLITGRPALSLSRRSLSCGMAQSVEGGATPECSGCRRRSSELRSSTAAPSSGPCMHSFGPTAKPPAMLSPRRRTPPTAGSPPLRSAWGFRSSRTTGSSAARQASRSRRLRPAERREHAFRMGPVWYRTRLCRVGGSLPCKQKGPALQDL